MSYVTLHWFMYTYYLHDKVNVHFQKQILYLQSGKSDRGTKEGEIYREIQKFNSVKVT